MNDPGVSLREHLDDRIDGVQAEIGEVKTEVHEIRQAVAGVVTWRALGAAITVAATILGVVWMVAGAS